MGPHTGSGACLNARDRVDYMSIYQILIGQVPEFLEGCVKSVADFAARSGNKLNVIKEIPKQYETTLKWKDSQYSDYYRNRLIKDFITFDLLITEPRILIVDWDVHLCRNFSFDAGSLPIFADFPFDCMIYNGDDLSHFIKMKEAVGDLSALKPGALTLNIGFGKYHDFIYKNFNRQFYHHFFNSEPLS